MKIAILHEDKDIFVQFTDAEFIELLEIHLLNGLSVSEAMEEIIKALKKKTLTA